MTRRTTITSLQQDETLHVPLDARTTLEVVVGTVVVRQPLRWLADTVVAPVVTLVAGQSCRLEQSGWVELRAMEGAAEVRSHRPAWIWAAGWRALGRQVKMGAGI